MNTTKIRSRRGARRGAAVLAGLLMAGTATLVAAPAAQADVTYIGGSSGTSFYAPAQVYLVTNCVGSTDQVATTVYASPLLGSGGQWFTSRIWARDVSNGVYGSWKSYGWTQKYVGETNTLSTAAADRKVQNTQTFWGTRGHSYQVWVEAYVAEGGRWVPLAKRYANHYTVWAAPQTNAYGETIAYQYGSPAVNCIVN